MKKIVLCGVLLAMSQSAMATEWVQVDKNNTFTSYIDKDSVKLHQFSGYGVKGQYVTAWTKYDFKQASTIGGKSYWQGKSFNYYDCQNQKWTFDNVIYYDKKGKVVDSFSKSISNSSSDTWGVVLDTTGEAMLTTACGFFGL